MSAAIGELTERLIQPNSEFCRWVDEVTEPPPDTEVHGRRHYSGILYVIRNRIKRALVFEHRSSREEREHHFDGCDDFGFRGSRFGGPAGYEDEFPGFG